jgi:hypothetical protein
MVQDGTGIFTDHSESGTFFGTWYTIFSSRHDRTVISPDIQFMEVIHTFFALVECIGMSLLVPSNIGSGTDDDDDAATTTPNDIYCIPPAIIGIGVAS